MRNIMFYFNLILVFIVPFVMLLTGSLLKKKPVTDMSSHNGYNTSSSRKSQAHWDYAQSIAPDIFIHYSKVLFLVEIILAVIIIVIKFSIIIGVWIGIAVGLAFLLYAFWRTESQIKKKFQDT